MKFSSGTAKSTDNTRLDTSHNRLIFTTVTVGSSLTSICLPQYPETPWWPPVGNNPVKMNRVKYSIEYAM